MFIFILRTWWETQMGAQMFRPRFQPPPSTLHVIQQPWKAPERLKPVYWKKSAICISSHQAWSSFRPGDHDIGSHSVTKQCTQRATIQDTEIRPTDPQCVHLRCASGGPEDHSSFCIDIVCPFRTPRHLGFLYHCVGWLCCTQWGSSTTGAGAFST